MRRCLKMVVVVLLATSLAGCGADGSGTTDKALLWVQPLRTHPVHAIMQAGFLSECEKLGYTCDVVGNDSAAEADIPGTITRAQTAMATTEYQAVGVYAMDPGLSPFIDELGEKGLPVVSWHFPIEEGSIPGLKAITGTKPEKYARGAASAIAEQIGGKGTVAVTQGSFNPTENLVATEFTDTMETDFPDIKVLEPELEGFDPSTATAKAVSILQSNPDVTAAFSTTGGGPQTWAGAQRQTGRKLTIIGMDYTRQNLDLVKNGEVYGIVAQPLFQEGAKTADLLAALAEGESVGYENWLPAPIVTADDLDKYYEFLETAGV